MTFDTVIADVRIVDGTGSPWFHGWIGIKDGRIVKVGRGSPGKGHQTLKGRGLVACPGFIDIHGHSDLTLLLNPTAESKVHQGVTTEVIGNCGYSLAPLTERSLKELRATAGRLGQEVSWDWRGFGEYLARLGRTSLNVAPLVGHGTVRLAVLGPEDRDPTPEELAEMERLVNMAMEEGAFGLSTGLIYPPGCFAGTEELTALARAARRHSGLYSTHIRGEGDTLVEAVREAIRIGEEAGVRVQISHHKAVGERNWEKVKETLRLMEEARARGVDVACDVYPYHASSTTLTACFPPWAHRGGLEELLRRLGDPAAREEIRRSIFEDAGWENFLRQGHWENILISGVRTERNRDLVGKSLQEIARLRSEDPFDALCDLVLEEEGDVSMVVFEISPEDVRHVLGHRLSCVGSDGLCLSPQGPLGEGKPHPRSYGTFPRVLAKYVREEGLFPLEEAIRKMTSLPARRIGLWDRGLIAPGFAADIVVFDPERVADQATFEEPHRFPVGIEHVLVNGEPVVERGEHTGAMPGRVLVSRP
ncbi:N-acyl-D-amino-acid deacylase family protein [Candidatus Bipolaricaulota sp. J31]